MKQKILSTSIVMLTLVALVCPADGQTVLVEAEGFANRGGWVIDQQFMDQMGSPFLLAHGLGVPVKDAATAVTLPAPGKYRVWVRTRNWVAPWKAPGAPGKFQLIIDHVTLPVVFGTEGAAWHWQDGGTVVIPAKRFVLMLHDLTGFDGRCDAIVFTSDMNFVPPNEGEPMAAFRRRMLGLPEQPQDAGTFDLVVVGGGIAGTCTAVSAARLGLQVALVQDRPVLGGNNSSEVRVHLNGKVNMPPYPALGGVVNELDTGLRGNAQPADHYNDQQKLDVVRAEKNIHLFLNMHAFKVEKQGDRIVAVIAQNIQNGSRLRFRAPLFADCTGDGTVGFLAGADYRMGRESRSETGEPLAPDKPDKMTMGASVQWYSVQTTMPTSFPECPWALQFNEQSCHYLIRGDWDWETGLDRNQITDFESIRDYALRAVYGNWAYLKNKSKDKAQYADRKLEWVAYIAGKRESRRLLGDVILLQQDIQRLRRFRDSFVTTTWSIDLHYPDPKNSKYFPGSEFLAISRTTPIKPYPIPYRCLYSRNVSNLFMAGRCISVSHVALGTVRVMRTGGMMGELVGMAASLCKKHATDPRGVYEHHLGELKQLARHGVGKPAETNDQAFTQALENGRLANEGLRRCRSFLYAWLRYADPKTGLIPRDLDGGKDIWNPEDSGAHNYPFMVLTAALTDRPLFERRMRDILAAETRLTSRVGNLPDTYSFSKQTFEFPRTDPDRIVLGSTEYVKDGLLPLSEWLGPGPWSERMLGILNELWRRAPVKTQHGNIVSTSEEINGEMLQTLPRVYWMTGQRQYLDWAIRIGDYYLLDVHHPTRDESILPLRDHGSEIISGLCELYATLHFAMPARQIAYAQPIHEMLDRILEVGVNEHGLFYNSINPMTGWHDTGLADTWGYNLDGFYTVYLIDKTEAYRMAVAKALSSLYDYYSYPTYKWSGAGGLADSIESAINLYNRVPVASAAKWMDNEINVLWRMQKPNGIIEGGPEDGHFARTTLMYSLWKTKGLTIQPWQEDVTFGAVEQGNALKIAIKADGRWQGKLVFDAPRHQTIMKMPLDWPRVNQLPEWFTVKDRTRYMVHDVATNSKMAYTGRQLADGLPMTLERGVERHLLVEPQ
jgi:FAD dependent oxidoreductase